MNQLSSPTLRPSKFTRFSNKNLVILRFGSPTTVLTGVATTASARRPGFCLVIDKIHVHGRTCDFDTLEYLRFIVTDAADVTYATLSVFGPNGNAATRQGSLNETIDFGGRVAIPENFRLSLQSTEPAGVNAPFTSGIVATVYAYYMPVPDAHRAGITMWGAGDGFVAGAVPANTSATELVAARAGYAIQVHGVFVNGQIITTTGSLLLSHYDTTTDRGVFKWYQSVANIMSPLWEANPALDFDLPVGHSLRYTAAGNVVNRIAVWVWGKYTKTPSTFNPYGFHSIKGTATSGAANVVNDTKRKWTASQFVGRTLRLVGGTGVGSTGVITANTATQITCGGGMTPAATPDATTQYEVDAGMGDKWWVFVDNTNADAVDTAYQVLDGRRPAFGVIRNVQFSAECGTADADPVIARSKTAVAQITACTPTRQGAAVANGGAAFGGLTALEAAASSISPVLGPPGLGDVQSMVHDVEVPIPVNAGVTLQFEVTQAWTGFSAHISGTLKPATAYSTKAAATTNRNQGGA